MGMRAYLHDHRLVIGAYWLGLLLLCGGLWLDPSHRVHGDTLIYVAVLVTIFAMVIGFIQYRRNQRWLVAWQAACTGDDAPLPHAATNAQAVIIQAAEAARRTHRQAFTKLAADQQDHQAFIDAWVHETKVPLAAMTLLLDSLDGQAPEQPLQALALQLDRVDHDVDQVLYYSRLETFSKDYLLHDHELVPLVQQVVVDNRNSFIAKHLQFGIDGDATVTTDGKWLRFILMQLFSNAIKYTPEGGKIHVTIATTKNEVTLAVTDSGIGIAQDEQHRVFEKGFTGTNGRNANEKSTGLGLYLADQLTQRLGHTLSLTSTPGAGTTVTIHFPHLDFYGDRGSTLTPHTRAR
ncbi:sensor histidine kinase [Lacticaseibacillus sp. GG6-2]